MTSQPKRRCQIGLRWLFVLPILWGLGWWWLNLPRRTAERFVEQIGSGARADVISAIGVEGEYTYIHWVENEYRVNHWTRERLVALDRSWSHVLLAKQDFQIPADSFMGAPTYLQFSVKRTKILLPPIRGDDYYGGTVFASSLENRD